jgi:hypothetical protein
MARYIDAEKAVEEARISYCKDCNSYNGVRCSACAFDDAMSYIEDAPTADVVEVVRCGECTKWDAHEGDEYGTCANGEYISRNDYCSLGERKTDNEQV